MRRYLPIIFFLCLTVAFGYILSVKREDAPLDSPLLGRPLPDFSVSSLRHEEKITGSQFHGTVTVINIFASWCMPCQAEIPAIKALAKEPGIALLGIAWRDRPEQVKAWLDTHGNPYNQVGLDNSGALTTVLGITGVPETYIIGKDGVLAYKLPAAITQSELQSTILPLLWKLKNAE